MCWHLVETTIESIGTIITKDEISLVKDIPHDVPTAIQHFRLESQHTMYAACPKCNHIYKGIPDPENGVLVYPEFCSYQHYGQGKKCKSPLLFPSTRNGVVWHVPVKPFISYNFHDWLSGLLSCPNNKTHMDSCWKNHSGSLDSKGSMKDIFDGSLIQEFKGPDGKHFSMASECNEGRYLFSLGFDNFNPLTNKQAGEKISVGALFVMCMNLPPNEHHKPENLFLAGIIPGPQEPSLDSSNSYFTPIVDYFEKLWWSGIRYTKTWKHLFGRLVHAALIAVICDIPAAHKIGGFSSCNHRCFCNICWCRKCLKRDQSLNCHGGDNRSGQDGGYDSEGDNRRVKNGHDSEGEEEDVRSKSDNEGDVPSEEQEIEQIVDDIEGDAEGVYQGYDDFDI